MRGGGGGDRKTVTMQERKKTNTRMTMAIEEKARIASKMQNKRRMISLRLHDLE